MSGDYSYVIAIPSYKRHKTIQDKTLKVLQDYDIPKDIIHIFVADNQEKILYEPLGYKTIVAAAGLINARNFILNYFPKNQHIVQMDDDIKEFIELDHTQKRSERKLKDLKDIIQQGFNMCLVTKSRLWGIYPSANGYFMNGSVTHSLKYIVGCFFGIINPKEELTLDAGQHNVMDGKEDYYRTLKMYQLDGSVVRLNFVAPKTAYLTEPGGLQTDPDRKKKHTEAVDFLIQEFPEWAFLNPKRKSGFTEMRLRSKKDKSL